jgi:hypothetical protein
MNPRQFATVAAELCGSVVRLGRRLVCWPRFARQRRRNLNRGPPRTISHRRRRTCGRTAGDRNGNAAIANADVATAAKSVTGMATDTTADSDKPESIVVAALPDLSQKLPPKDLTLP